MTISLTFLCIGYKNKTLINTEDVKSCYTHK